ncbi:MAG: response regulator [Bradymonadaceae bacterium]
MSITDSSLPAQTVQCQTIKNWQRWLVRLLGRAPTLLIAEDEDETLTSLIAWFEYAGFDVRGVRDGSELLVLLEPILQGEEGDWWQPDAIMTDLRMPGVEPFNLVEGLRYVGVGTPIVVVSAFGDNNIRRRVDAMECASFVAKPFDIIALYKTVCQAIYRQHRNSSTATAAGVSPPV